MKNRSIKTVIAISIGIVLPLNLFCQGWYFNEENANYIFYKTNKVKNVKTQWMPCTDSIYCLIFDANISKDGLIQSINYFDKGVLWKTKTYSYDTQNRLIKTIEIETNTMDSVVIYISYKQDSIITGHINIVDNIEVLDSIINHSTIIQIFDSDNKLNKLIELVNGDTLIQYDYSYMETFKEKITTVTTDSCLYMKIFDGGNYIREDKYYKCSKDIGLFEIRYLNNAKLPYLIINGGTDHSVSDDPYMIDIIYEVVFLEYDKNNRLKERKNLFYWGHFDESSDDEVILHENGLPDVVFYPRRIALFKYLYEFY